MINIMITTNEQPGTTLSNGREIPKTLMRRWVPRTAIRRTCDFKKVNITLWPECFLDSCLEKNQQKNLHGQKTTVWKTALIPQSDYIQLWIFSLFSTSLMVVPIEMGYQYVSSLTQWAIVPNSKIENRDCLFCFC